MFIFFDPNNAPFRDVPAPMIERAVSDLADHLREQGITLFGESHVNAVRVSLRNLAATLGLERGRQAVYMMLENLRAVRVDLDAADVQHLLGANVLSHAVSRGMESGVQPLLRLLTNISPDELYDNLDRATGFVLNDQLDPRIEGIVKSAATLDLIEHGLLEGAPDESYRAGLEPRQEPEPAPLPREFQTSARPYRSAFDRDGSF